MRHKIAGNRLSRNKSLRKATLRDLAKATLIEERICTTRAKAKEARRLVEKLITLGKKDTLAARRRAFAILCDHGVVAQLFKETAVRFKSRMGGYTRIIPYVKRAGDNADLAFLELTEKSREIISGQKRNAAKKQESQADVSVVSDAEVKTETKAAAAKADKAKLEHGKSDVKAKTKTAKPAGGAVKKMFQRKTGGE